MRYLFVVIAALFALALSACDQRPAAETPAAPEAVVVVPVPGPAGPQGMTGDEGAKGEQGDTGGDTVVVVPAPGKSD